MKVVIFTNLIHTLGTFMPHLDPQISKDGSACNAIQDIC